MKLVHCEEEIDLAPKRNRWGVGHVQKTAHKEKPNVHRAPHPSHVLVIAGFDRRKSSLRYGYITRNGQPHIFHRRATT